MTKPEDVVREALERMRDNGDRPGMYDHGEVALAALSTIEAELTRLRAERDEAVAALREARDHLNPGLGVTHDIDRILARLSTPKEPEDR